MQCLKCGEYFESNKFHNCDFSLRKNEVTMLWALSSDIVNYYEKSLSSRLNTIEIYDLYSGGRLYKGETKNGQRSGYGIEFNEQGKKYTKVNG